MQAEITHENHHAEIEVRVGSHHMHFGGQADGFCYEHQSFDCELTKEELEAIEQAEGEREDDG